VHPTGGDEGQKGSACAASFMTRFPMRLPASDRRTVCAPVSAVRRTRLSRAPDGRGWAAAGQQQQPWLQPACSSLLLLAAATGQECSTGRTLLYGTGCVVGCVSCVFRVLQPRAAVKLCESGSRQRARSSSQQGLPFYWVTAHFPLLRCPCIKKPTLIYSLTTRTAIFLE
jgi:hypothetical protein